MLSYACLRAHKWLNALVITSAHRGELRWCPGFIGCMQYACQTKMGKLILFYVDQYVCIELEVTEIQKSHISLVTR